MHIRHADDDEEIKKREWKKERQIHRNSQERRVKDQNDREKGGD